MGRLRLDDIRRQELVDAAIRAVASNGLEKATVAVIAREADISPGIVHHYFGDKTSLLASAMRSLRAPLTELYGEHLKTGGPPAPSRLGAVLRACFDPSVFTPLTVSAWTAFSAAAPHVRAFGRIRSAQRQRLVSTVSDALRGRVADDHRRWYADVIASTIDGAWFNAATVEGAASPDHALAAVETLLASLLQIETEGG